MEPYKLSVAAALDFENILDFGIDTFGHTQALEYQHGMIKRFEELAAYPKQYVAVDGIRAEAFTIHIQFITELNRTVFLLCGF